MAATTYTARRRRIMAFVDWYISRTSNLPFYFDPGFARFAGFTNRELNAASREIGRRIKQSQRRAQEARADAESLAALLPQTSLTRSNERNEHGI